MIIKTIADTSVIVASLDNKDEWYGWTTEQMKRLPAPFLTCEVVIAESCFLLSHLPNGEQNVLGLLSRGALQIDFSLSAEIEAVKALMKKYENVPMSPADACPVRMSEMEQAAKIFTLDGDFTIYRKNRREKIPLIYPE